MPPTNSLEVVIGRVQIQEQLINLVDDFCGPRVLAVNLVDNRDRRQTGFERLLQDALMLVRMLTGVG